MVRRQGCLDMTSSLQRALTHNNGRSWLGLSRMRGWRKSWTCLTTRRTRTGDRLEIIVSYETSYEIRLLSPMSTVPHLRPNLVGWNDGTENWLNWLPRPPKPEVVGSPPRRAYHFFQLNYHFSWQPSAEVCVQCLWSCVDTFGQLMTGIDLLFFLWSVPFAFLSDRVELLAPLAKPTKNPASRSWRDRTTTQKFG